jgi:putative membrane protein
MRLKACLALAWIAMLHPVVAHAHGAVFSGDAAHAPIWLSQSVFVAAWFSYPFGAARKRPTSPQRLAFHGAMLIAGLALFGPFDDWAESSSALHMVQHMLLIVVVAPLMVLARPLPQWRAALGPALDGFWRPVTALGRHPGGCALLHAAAIWFWHAPAPYMAAVVHTGLHVLEHVSFLFTGWLFWWSVLQAGRNGAPAAAMALLFTATHTGMLGALLTFSSTPLYWRESRELWDQQLAGLVMWIPGGFVYLGVAAWAAFRWLSPDDERDGTGEVNAMTLGANRTDAAA